MSQLQVLYGLLLDPKITLKEDTYLNKILGILNEYQILKQYEPEVHLQFLRKIFSQKAVYEVQVVAFSIKLMELFCSQCKGAPILTNDELILEFISNLHTCDYYSNHVIQKHVLELMKIFLNELELGILHKDYWNYFIIPSLSSPFSFICKLGVDVASLYLSKESSCVSSDLFYLPFVIKILKESSNQSPIHKSCCKIVSRFLKSTFHQNHQMGNVNTLMFLETEKLHTYFPVSDEFVYSFMYEKLIALRAANANYKVPHCYANLPCLSCIQISIDAFSTIISEMMVYYANAVNYNLSYHSSNYSILLFIFLKSMCIWSTFDSLYSTLWSEWTTQEGELLIDNILIKQCEVQIVEEHADRHKIYLHILYLMKSKSRKLNHPIPNHWCRILNDVLLHIDEFSLPVGEKLILALIDNLFHVLSMQLSENIKDKSLSTILKLLGNSIYSCKVLCSCWKALEVILSIHDCYDFESINTVLIRHLHSPYWENRDSVLEILLSLVTKNSFKNFLGSSELLNIVHSLLKDEQDFVRESVIKLFLELISSPDTLVYHNRISLVNEIFQCCESDSSQLVRKAGISFLKKYHEKKLWEEGGLSEMRWFKLFLLMCHDIADDVREIALRFWIEILETLKSVDISSGRNEDAGVKFMFAANALLFLTDDYVESIQRLSISILLQEVNQWKAKGWIWNNEDVERNSTSCDDSIQMSPQLKQDLPDAASAYIESTCDNELLSKLLKPSLSGNGSRLVPSSCIKLVSFEDFVTCVDKLVIPSKYEVWENELQSVIQDILSSNNNEDLDYILDCY